MNQNQISRWIAMAEASLKRSLTKKITEHVKTGKCLHCDSSAVKRGLCQKHYSQFRRELASKPKSDRNDFEVNLIRDGKILAVGWVAEICRENPFAESTGAA